MRWLSLLLTTCPWAAWAEPLTLQEEGLQVRVASAESLVEYMQCAKGASCAWGKDSRAIAVDSRFDVQKATLTAVPALRGGRIAWVRVPEKNGAGAFEVLLAGGSAEPLFAGVTAAEVSPSISTDRLQRHDSRAGTLILRSSTPAGGGLCGQPRALGPVQAWDGTKWSSASVARIDAEAAKKARVLDSTRTPRSAGSLLASVLTPSKSTGEPPARRYLEPIDGSDASFGRALIDGDLGTAWTETRSGDGVGEYATFRLDPSLRVTGFTLRITPTRAVPQFAAPRTLFVLLEGAIHRVQVPAGAESIELNLPSAARSSCVSVVLGEPDPKAPTPRSVGFAELGVRTALDAEPVSALLTRATQGADKDEALATLLGRADVDWKIVYDTLDPTGREKLQNAVAARGCEEATKVFALGLGSTDEREATRATQKIEQCRREAAPTLTALLGDRQLPRAREAGRMLALVAPSVAMRELPPRLGHEDTRGSFWPALSKAFRNTEISQLRAALAAATGTAQLDVVLAMGDRARDVAETAVVVRSAARASDLTTRYRAVGPALVIGTDEDVRALLTAPEPLLRDRVLAALITAPRRAALEPTIAATLRDPNPRVRAAAAEYFRVHSANIDVKTLQTAAADPWPFVRFGVVRAIGNANAQSKRALLGTLRERFTDRNMDVRRAALGALAGLPASEVHDDIMERLDDEHEAIPVRVEAARALGAVCAWEELDRLTILAEATLEPQRIELEREVGLGAIESLGALHPADLPKRLAPLLAPKAPPMLKGAAQRALRAPARCKR